GLVKVTALAGLVAGGVGTFAPVAEAVQSSIPPRGAGRSVSRGSRARSGGRPSVNCGWGEAIDTAELARVAAVHRWVWRRRHWRGGARGGRRRSVCARLRPRGQATALSRAPGAGGEGEGLSGDRGTANRPPA